VFTSRTFANVFLLGTDRRGLGPDSAAEELDSLRRDEPWLAGLYAAAVTGRTAYGPNAGRRVTRVGDQIDPESIDLTLSPRCATVDGSLHANVAVHADDRPRLASSALLCANQRATWTVQNSPRLD